MKKNILMKGHTLIEVLIALGIGGVILSAITILVTNSLSNAQFSKNQNLATKHAQDGLENIRRIRNANYTNFTSYNGTYCLDKDQATLTAPAACTSPNVDNFIRSVQIQPNAGCGTNASRVVVSVAWTDGKCQTGATYCHKSELSSCLSTTNPIVAP